MERTKYHPSPEQITADEFFRHPPVAILVYDNFTAASERKSQQIMQVRCALAAKIWHSELYPTDQERPFIVSFAGVHQGDKIAGSKKVARILRSFKIPDEKIVTRTTTITATGDDRQYHSLAKEREMRLKGPLAIATTNGMAWRSNQSVANHQRVHRDFGPVYVIYPKHILNDLLPIPSALDPRAARKMLKSTALGRSSAVNHGFVEGVAWAFSAIPPLRPFQHKLEEWSHPGMRQVESSRYVAEGMKTAADKLEAYRRKLIVAGYPRKSNTPGKIKPDDDSAMALAPGLYTRTADRGGPNDKELKIQALVAKLPRLPEMPPHG